MDPHDAFEREGRIHARQCGRSRVAQLAEDRAGSRDLLGGQHALADADHDRGPARRDRHVQFDEVDASAENRVTGICEMRQLFGQVRYGAENVGPALFAGLNQQPSADEVEKVVACRLIGHPVAFLLDDHDHVSSAHLVVTVSEILDVQVS
mgnify:CR=1 FL=1